MDFKVATQVTEVLEKEGLDVFVFAKCQADAPSAICDEGAAFYREKGADGIVAVGCGSNLDTAKAIGIIISQHGTTIRDYYHLEEDAHELKLITMCTTSGTGSEISKWCVIGDEATGAKEMPVYKPDMAIVPIRYRQEQRRQPVWMYLPTVWKQLPTKTIIHMVIFSAKKELNLP